MKVLLTEGASTSARQTIYALGRLGATVDLCDPQSLCLGRFSRFVRTWRRCPSFTSDPEGYVSFLIDLLKREQYDVLLPVHDQVYLLSQFREELNQYTAVALPAFESVARVQSKAEFARLLTELELPHPATSIVNGPAALAEVRDFPCYVKLPYSTAGRGVWLINNAEEMARLVHALQSPRPGEQTDEILVQRPAEGVLCVVQSVFQHGALVAAHAYRSRAAGVGGSAHARVGVHESTVIDHLSRLGARLAWHGALHLEFIYSDQSGQPTYIEANPRIGETMNATLSGLNLCEALLDVSLGREVHPAPPRPGVRTHSLLMSMMAAAERGDSRRALAGELFNVWRGHGVYADSEDEIVRPKEDPLSLIPAAAVIAQLFFQPSRARKIVDHAVQNYALTAEAAHRIQLYRQSRISNPRPTSHC